MYNPELLEKQRSYTASRRMFYPFLCIWFIGFAFSINFFYKIGFSNIDLSFFLDGFQFWNILLLIYLFLDQFRIFYVSKRNLKHIDQEFLNRQ